MGEATTWVIVLQAGAFLLYQVPARWLSVTAGPGSDLGLVLWWVGLAVGALFWTRGHRRRGLAHRVDLWRSLRLVLLFHTVTKGVPLVVAALSSRDEARPFVVVFALWFVASAAGVAVGLTSADAAVPEPRRDPPPPTPPGQGLDALLGAEGHRPPNDPYEDAHVWRVDRADRQGSEPG